MSERQKLELSFSGIAAGALATVTATVVASFFGVYGTIVGAAASSVVSTAGAAVYQHFFRRTGDKLKVAAQVGSAGLRSTLVSEGRAGTVTTPDPRPSRERRPEQPAEPERRAEARPSRPRTLADVMGQAQEKATARIEDDERGQGEAAGDTSGSGEGTGETGQGLGAFGDVPADDRTARRGAFAEAGGTESGDREVGAGETETAGGPGEPGETNLAGSDDAETMAINRMTGVSGVYTARGVRDRPTLGAMLGWVRSRWATLLGAAVVVFAVVMGGVTLAEKIMDKPLSDAVTGKSSTGGYSLTGGSGASKDTPTDTPSTSPTPTPTDSTEQNPGNTAPSTPNPQRSANPGRQSQAPQPTTQPSTVPSTQPTSTSGGDNGLTNDTGGNVRSTP